MCNKSVMFAAVLAMLCMDSALAQSAERRDSGFYMGLGIGRSNANLKSSDFSTGDPAFKESKDETDTSYKAYIGWRFNRYLATELHYTNLGTYKYFYSIDLGGADLSKSRVDYSAVSWAGSVVGTIPITGGLSVFGRGGVSFNRANRSALQGDFKTTPEVPAASKDRWSGMGGIGLQYDFTREVAARLEYEYLGRFGESRGPGTPVSVTGPGSANFPDNTGQAQLYAWTLSAMWRF